MKTILFNKVKDILKLYETLENLYNELAELEIKGKIFTEDYEKTLSYIQMTLDYVNNKLRNVNLTDEELIDLEQLLAELNGYDDEDHDLIIDILNLSTNNKIRKMCMQLFYLSHENNTGYIIEDVEGGDDVEDDFIDQEEATEIIESEIQKEYKLELIKDKLISHTLMEYLLDAISKEQNIDIKNELIRVKYRLIYLISSLEQSFVNSPKNFLKVPLYQELLNYYVKEEEDLYQELYSAPIYYQVEYELNHLSSLNDEYYDNYQNQTKAILRVLYIKTFISINYDKKIDARIKNIRQRIENLTKSHISRGKIQESFIIKKELSIPKKD